MYLLICIYDYVHTHKFSINLKKNEISTISLTENSELVFISKDNLLPSFKLNIYHRR